MNLAFRIRPKSLDEFVGQEHLVGKDKFINRMLENKNLSSLIFWGPPGIGKTTLAFLIARKLDAVFYEFSGVSSGKDDLKKVIEKTKNDLKNKKQTILFIDEIHRWNKAQQDALLPNVENGLITLIGATTENPSFNINSALLSRCKVLVLKGLNLDNLNLLIENALKNKEQGLGKYKKILTNNARDILIRLSGGDARIMLNALEIAVINYKEKNINEKIILDVFQTKSTNLYDKNGEEHYNTISAFIKSMRGSNIDASLYYLARMLENGEDPKFIARRMVIFASEDIGMAQPTAIVVANEVFKAVETIGFPECAINLAHGTVYLASAKKDRSSVDAYIKAREDVLNFPNEPIPLHLRNAPTKLMQELGYAKGYKWSNDYVGPLKNQSFLPEKLKNKKFYNL